MIIEREVWLVAEKAEKNVICGRTTDYSKAFSARVDQYEIFALRIFGNRKTKHDCLHRQILFENINPPFV